MKFHRQSTKSPEVTDYSTPAPSKLSPGFKDFLAGVCFLFMVCGVLPWLLFTF